MKKFIGIITTDLAMFAKANQIITFLFPQYSVLDSPVEVESEADTINLYDGVLIKILPADNVIGLEYVDIDGVVSPVDEEDLYYKLEALQTQIYEQSTNQSHC